MDYLVDTHCHLDFDWYADDLVEVLERAQAAGVGRIVAPGIDLASSRRVLDLAHRHPGVVAAVGVHPNSSSDWQDRWLEDIRRMAEDERVVAIGEIGLDYYRDHSPPAVQRLAFQAQLEAASELGLPFIVHNREADEDVLDLMRRYGDGHGVLHSFSSTWAVAQRALDMGYFLGFTGPITFKNAEEVRDVAGRAPLDRILVETDGPFLTPHPYRGRRNEPAYVRYVAERLAEVKGLTVSTVSRATSANAARLFGDALTTAP